MEVYGTGESRSSEEKEIKETGEADYKIRFDELRLEHEKKLKRSLGGTKFTPNQAAKVEGESKKEFVELDYNPAEFLRQISQRVQLHKTRIQNKFVSDGINRCDGDCGRDCDPMTKQGSFSISALLDNMADKVDEGQNMTEAIINTTIELHGDEVRDSAAKITWSFVGTYVVDMIEFIDKKLMEHSNSACGIFLLAVLMSYIGSICTSKFSCPNYLQSFINLFIWFLFYWPLLTTALACSYLVIALFRVLESNWNNIISSQPLTRVMISFLLYIVVLLLTTFVDTTGVSISTPIKEIMTLLQYFE